MCTPIHHALSTNKAYTQLCGKMQRYRPFCVLVINWTCVDITKLIGRRSIHTGLSEKYTHQILNEIISIIQQTLFECKRKQNVYRFPQV